MKLRIFGHKLLKNKYIMKHINNYELFLEENNPNTPQGYLNALSKKPVLKNNNKKQQQQQTPTEEVDTILQQTEEQKQKILARKDAIEKGLLNNIQTLEPDNQVDVKTQVGDYKNQVTEFDKTVKQIGKLNQALKKSEQPSRFKSPIQKAREQTKF
jgi:hypothetical protein